MSSEFHRTGRHILMETPCKNICQMDRVRGLCTGCGRTLAEIGAWRDMTDAERRAVMASLDERMRRLGLAVAPPPG